MVQTKKIIKIEKKRKIKGEIKYNINEKNEMVSSKKIKKIKEK